MRYSAILRDDPEIGALMVREEERLGETLNLIAAEKHMPASVLEALGGAFNTKTNESYPGRRFHAGCALADEVESLAVLRAGTMPTSSR